MTHIGDPLSEAEAAWLIGQVASTYTYNAMDKCNIKVGAWSGNSINNCKFFVGSVMCMSNMTRKLFVETSLMILVVDINCTLRRTKTMTAASTSRSS